MSTQQVQVMVPPPVHAPRGANWAAQAWVRLLRGRDAPAAPSPYQRQTPTLWQAIGQSIWQAFEATGQRRAARELHETAQRWESIDPAVAQQMHDAVRHLNPPQA